MNIAIEFFKSPKLFPNLIIILSLCAAVRYGFAMDLKHTLYSACAAIITTCVTY